MQEMLELDAVSACGVSGRNEPILTYHNTKLYIKSSAVLMLTIMMMMMMMTMMVYSNNEQNQVVFLPAHNNNKTCISTFFY